MPGWLLVALGSALGGVARFGVSTFGVRWLGPAFPWGTLAVNVIGSAFIGWLSASLPMQPVSARLFLMTGVCGGFTTFSAFSLELVGMIERHSFASAAAYVVGSVVLSLGATFIGLWTVRGLT